MGGGWPSGEHLNNNESKCNFITFTNSIVNPRKNKTKKKNK